MTPGPLPPHERAWRHPSELAAPAHEPTSRLGHFLIGSTAALSLLLVAWLAISMTPKRYGDANEVRTAPSDSAAATPFGLAAGSPGDDLTPAEHVLRVMSTIIAARSTQDDNASTVAATFIGDADRTTVTAAAVTPVITAVQASSSVLAPTTPREVPDTAASAEIEAIGEDPAGEDGIPASSDVAVLTDTTEPVDSSSDPAAPADSTATSTTSSSTSSSSSTTSTSTSTSTSTTTSTTSTSSTTTIALSSSPKQFS